MDFQSAFEKIKFLCLTSDDDEKINALKIILSGSNRRLLLAQLITQELSQVGDYSDVEFEQLVFKYWKAIHNSRTKFH